MVYNRVTSLFAEGPNGEVNPITKAEKDTRQAWGGKESKKETKVLVPVVLQMKRNNNNKHQSNKRKSNNISLAANQPQQIIPNQNATPATVQQPR